uniref:heparinase II/III domain-containing protein n=1 Tax=Falsiroseomonas oryziterrae TaxID=2911368 RepID=UPI001F17BBBD
EDAGCAWLGLPRPAATLPRPARWVASGTMGWEEAGAAAVLRTGPLGFRPSQCDLLHLSLRDGACWVIRDGGTGSYDPPSPAWFALWGAAAHNAPVFDETDPMPRIGRFLLARWPRLAARDDGAALRDARGNRVTRRVFVAGRTWTIEDRVAGRFRRVAWHWRLCPGRWQRSAAGLVSPLAHLSVGADAPLGLDLVAGEESPAYGALRAAPVLRVTAAAPVTWMRLRILLPGAAAGSMPPASSGGDG